MSVSFDIDAQPRSDSGKGASRRLRRAGLVPGIIYGARQDSAMISLNHNELLQHLDREAFYSSVLLLKLPNGQQKVVLKDVQRHPAKPFILHVDFQRIAADEKIRMHVPLHFINEDKAKGVKMGGMISHHISDLEITCLPKDLPEYIDIDMLEMDIGDAIHLSEIKLPEGVEFEHSLEQDLPVASVHTGHAEEEEEEEKAEEGPEEGEVGKESPSE